MNSEVKKRKKRFWAFCLVFVLMLGNVMPMSVMAEEYDVSYDPDAGKYYINADILQPGDVIKPSIGFYGIASIIYYDEDESRLDDMSEELNSDSVQVTVEEYNGALTPDAFKGWAVKQIIEGSGNVKTIELIAVAYTQSNITYILYGGDNASSNPDHYYEGKEEIILEDASKEGYTFEGWYSDSGFTTPVTSISTTQTGDITLYAKFTSNQPDEETYDINYELNGGTNGAGNPATYTFGTGVGSFADASKEGYTFEGWYMEPDFRIKVDGIHTDQRGDITLYAKFVEKTSEKTESKKEEKEGQGEPYCTHNFVYTVLQEATETQDGLMGMQCSFCGAIKENSLEPVSAYQIFTRLCEKKIREAKGTELTIETGIWVSFHKSIMAALAEKPDLNLTINYTYQHKKYTVTIPAGTDVMALLNEDGYCGFRYLDQQFGGKEIQ